VALTSGLVVHHLDSSRSQRILWLLEELGVPYEIKRYSRDKATLRRRPSSGRCIRSENHSSFPRTVR